MSLPVIDNDLEILLDEETPLRCESGHRFVKECSIDVFYMVGDCNEEARMCRNAVEHPKLGVAVRQTYQFCAKCNRPAADCWTIRPI